MLAHECKDSADVKQWLLEELEHEKDRDAYPVTIHGDDQWLSIKGFRRAFCSHNVYYKPSTKQLAFHVEEYPDFINFPNYGFYDTYEALIDGVVAQYTTQWNLPVVKDHPHPETST